MSLYYKIKTSKTDVDHVKRDVLSLKIAIFHARSYVRFLFACKQQHHHEAEKTSSAIIVSVIDFVALSFTTVAILHSTIDYSLAPKRDGGPNARWLSES